MTYQLLHFLLRILSSIPFCILYPLSDVAFYLLYYIVRYRRKIVRKNLTESFPQKNPVEIKHIEKKFYHFFMDMILESGKMTTISPEEMKKRMKFINVEEINILLQQKKSIAIYLGHFGNWEWISSMPLWLEKNITSAQIYHKLRNENMDRLILYNRERMGATCVDMRKTARYINEMAQNQQTCAIGFIADQSPKKREVRYFTPFLHHKTPVLTGTEKITKHYGFEAWFLKINRIKRGYYEAEFIQMHKNPQTLPDFELTAIYFQLLEKEIIRKPEMYLWTHNRFKHAEKLD